ncbi:MAG: DedA family protein [Candidatus Woesebacteria bacterium]
MIFPHFDLIELIQTVGYVGLFGIVFAESGLFFGFFLPGDSLLFTAGLLASQGVFHLWVLVPLLVAAAVLGDNAGYWTGKKLGSWLMRQKDSFFFKKKYLTQAQRFYEKHGGKALILARFIPAVRTFAPIAAGIANMHYEKFFLNNIVGGTLWASGMVLGGYFLGRIIPNADKYLLPIIAIIVVVSIIPAILHMRGGEKELDPRDIV